MSKKTMNIAESNILLELCEKYKNVIECKKTDIASNALKEEGWQKIGNEFNAINTIVRDVKTLKTKYKNLKYATKNKVAVQRQVLYGTGGGPYVAPEMNLSDERMLSILSNKESEGIQNTVDDDAIGNKSKSCSPNILEDILEEMKKEDFTTPKPGPATLRTKVTSELKTQPQIKRSKETKWDKLAVIKHNWTEAKFKAEVELVEKLKEQVDYQNKMLKEKHDIEMEILRTKLEKEKIELKKLKTCEEPN